uniref:Uncharacterized protein n=1 Tax=Eutreptiella gymnastica TaxID=73025 RepID=A0A7S1I369_9EUGL
MRKTKAVQPDAIPSYQVYFGPLFGSGRFLWGPKLPSSTEQSSQPLAQSDFAQEDQLGRAASIDGPPDKVQNCVPSMLAVRVLLGRRGLPSQFLWMRPQL